LELVVATHSEEGVGATPSAPLIVAGRADDVHDRAEASNDLVGAGVTAAVPWGASLVAPAAVAGEVLGGAAGHERHRRRLTAIRTEAPEPWVDVLEVALRVEAAPVATIDVVAAAPHGAVALPRAAGAVSSNDGARDLDGTGADRDAASPSRLIVADRRRDDRGGTGEPHATALTGRGVLGDGDVHERGSGPRPRFRPDAPAVAGEVADDRRPCDVEPPFAPDAASARGRLIPDHERIDQSQPGPAANGDAASAVGEPARDCHAGQAERASVQSDRPSGEGGVLRAEHGEVLDRHVRGGAPRRRSEGRRSQRGSVDEDARLALAGDLDAAPQLDRALADPTCAGDRERIEPLRHQHPSLGGSALDRVSQ